MEKYEIIKTEKDYKKKKEAIKWINEQFPEWLLTEDKKAFIRDANQLIKDYEEKKEQKKLNKKWKQ
jgi:hypothetical protein